MLVIDDALDVFYLGSFLFGVLFSAVSHLLGAVHLGHWPHGAHAGGHGVGGHASAPRAPIGPFNPASVLAFVSWFGGVGYPARHALGLVSPISVVCGLVGGAVGGVLVWLFLVKVLLPQDRVLDPDDFRLPGVVARVSSPVRAGGTGEIVYEQGGVRHVSAARGADGLPLSRGQAVVVLGCERGVASVRPLTPAPAPEHDGEISAAPIAT